MIFSKSVKVILLKLIQQFMIKKLLLKKPPVVSVIRTVFSILVIIFANLLVIIAPINKVFSQTIDISSEDPKISDYQKYPRIRVFSNKVGELITSDGRIYALTPRGGYVFFKFGWNNFTVRGKNILKQKYRIYIEEKHLVENIFIAMRDYIEEHQNLDQNNNKDQQKTDYKEVAQNDGDNLDQNVVEISENDQYLQEIDDFDDLEQQAPSGYFPYPYYHEIIHRKPRTMRSICHKAYFTTPLTQRYRIEHCNFRDLEEELLYTGPLFSPINQEDSIIQDEVDLLYSLIWKFQYSQQLSIIAEQIYRKSLYGTFGFEVAAFASVLEGNCTRVVDIANEMDKINLLSMSVLTYLGLCYEQYGNDHIAIKYLKEKYAEHTPTDPLGASVNYHLGRITMKKSTPQAKIIFNQCLAKYPWFRPCNVAAAIIELQYGKYKSHKKLIGRYPGKMREKIWPHILKATEYISNNKTEQALNFIENHPYHNISFSLVILKIFIARLSKKSSAFYERSINHTYVMDYKSAKLMLNLIDNGTNSYLYRSAIHLMYRDLITHRHEYLNKITNSYYQRDKCLSLIYFRTPLTSSQNLKKHHSHYEQIFDKMASCLIKLNRLQEAEKYLQKMQKTFPNSWLALYRTGLLYRKKGSKFLALNYQKQALNFATNNNNLSIIAKEIQELKLEVGNDPFYIEQQKQQEQQPPQPTP